VEILLGLIAGAAIGIGVHLHIGARSTRGAVLAPMIGTVSAGAAWTALTWAGLGAATVWPWLAAVLVPLAVTYPVVIMLARTRAAHDANERARLGLG
jgi:hypothetical protein